MKREYSYLMKREEREERRKKKEERRKKANHAVCSVYGSQSHIATIVY